MFFNISKRRCRCFTACLLLTRHLGQAHVEINKSSNTPHFIVSTDLEQTQHDILEKESRTNATNTRQTNLNEIAYALVAFAHTVAVYQVRVRRGREYIAEQIGANDPEVNEQHTYDDHVEIRLKP